MPPHSRARVLAVVQRAHFTLEAERMYSFFTRTRPPHHNCDPDGKWWLLMEDTHSSQYEYLAPPVEPDPAAPSAYSLIGGGRPESLVRRRTVPPTEPAYRTTVRDPKHGATAPALSRGERACEGACVDGGQTELSHEGPSSLRGADEDLETLMA